MKEIASDGQSSMTRKYNLGHFCLRVESSEATELEAMPKDIALIMGRRKKQVVVGVVSRSTRSSNRMRSPIGVSLPIAEGFRGGIIWDMVQGLAGIHTA
jgi:hypothetical protein